MQLLMGADRLGFPLKAPMKAYLHNKGYIIEDVGVEHDQQSTPYYQIASQVAHKVAQGEVERAILICGTGMGMAIIANKHPGIYAAVCESQFAAEKSRSINNANILTLGALVTTEAVAKQIVDVWFSTKFTQGWEPEIQSWLIESMTDIVAFEQKAFK